MKTIIGQATSREGLYYAVNDLVVIMKSRREEGLDGYFRGWKETPFNIPFWLPRAEEAGEVISKKQRRKLLKRYWHEWNYFLAKFTIEADTPDTTMMRN